MPEHTEKAKYHFNTMISSVTQAAKELSGVRMFICSILLLVAHEIIIYSHERTETNDLDNKMDTHSK